MGKVLDKAEKLKAGIRAKVKHPFRVIKRQFDLVKDRYKGLAKNAALIATLFALSNLWMARHPLMEVQARVRLKGARKDRAVHRTARYPGRTGLRWPTFGAEASAIAMTIVTIHLLTVAQSFA